MQVALGVSEEERVEEVEEMEEEVIDDSSLLLSKLHH